MEDLTQNTGYSKAPISELVLGVTFNKPILGIDGLIFTLLGELVKGDFRRMRQEEPIISERFIPKFGIIQQILDPMQSGEKIYKLRSPDNRWMIQLQWNKIYINWVREDHEKISENRYPGFKIVLEKLESLLSRVQDSNTFNEDSIAYLEMTYQDRVDWAEHEINGIHDIEDVCVIPLPKLTSPNIDNTFSGLDCKYTIPVKSVKNGFLGVKVANTKISLNEAEIPDDLILKNIFAFQFSLKGELSEGQSVKQWFEKANDYQLELFNSFFSESTLNKWR